MAAVVTRMVQAREVCVTYFVPDTMYHRIDTELMRGFNVEDRHLRNRIRHVPFTFQRYMRRFIGMYTQNARLVALSAGDQDVTSQAVFCEIYVKSCLKLLKSGSAYCSVTGNEWNNVNPPHALLMDVSSNVSYRRRRV